MFTRKYLLSLLFTLILSYGMGWIGAISPTLFISLAIPLLVWRVLMPFADFLASFLTKDNS